MKTIKRKYNTYDFSELNESAKERARQWYLDDDMRSSDWENEIEQDLMTMFPNSDLHMEDGMIFYLWKSNLPEDEKELKKYLMDSLIVQKEYVLNLKRDFLKPAKIRLQFIGERTDSVVIPYKEFDDFVRGCLEKAIREF